MLEGMNRIVAVFSIALVLCIFAAGTVHCPFMSSSVEAGEPSNSWTAHQKYFAVRGNPDACEPCHQIAADGIFRVVGLKNGPEIKTTSEAVAKMPPYYRSWATSNFLDHKHGKRGITCASCHGTSLPTEATKKERCFSCHGDYKKLVGESPVHKLALEAHIAVEPLECNACHNAHKKSKLVCNECHDLLYDVP